MELCLTTGISCTFVFSSFEAIYTKSGDVSAWHQPPLEVPHVPVANLIIGQHLGYQGLDLGVGTPL
jgi:hypothetical protein